MANSGEGDEWVTRHTICNHEVDEKPCVWMGYADVCIDSDDNAHFICGNGHRNDFRWDDTC